MSSKEQQIKAAVLERLVEHLQSHKEVQNIDLMILANFCRNCLSRWYMEAAQELDEDIDQDKARELIYGMPYTQWKEEFQLPATPEQLEALEKRSK